MAGAVHVDPANLPNNHTNDYLKSDSSNPPRYPNRDFVKASNTQYVRVWTDWSGMQPFPSSSFQQTCDWLNSGDRATRMQALDRQIAAINSDRNASGANIGAMLVTSGFPSWANGTRQAGCDIINNPGDPRCGNTAEVPTDRSTSGPWAWWITYLFLRYTGLHNPLGPGSNGSWQGNPSSARIDSFEICNEPNQTYRFNGQSGEGDPAGMGCVIADMIMTADAMANFWKSGGYRVPTFLAPGTSDVSQFRPVTFADNVLYRLNQSNWRGAAPWFWTHHNYQDIKNGQTTRLTDARGVLARYPWSGQNRVIWLTEGGYDANQSLPDDPLPGQPSAPNGEPEQNILCLGNFNAVRNLSNIYMWTNHMLNEEPHHPFETAFFNDWIPQPGTKAGGTQGSQRQWGATWRGLVP
jgi:hypothetical protein